MTIGIEFNPSPSLPLKRKGEIVLPTEWAALDRKLWSKAAFRRAVLSLDINRVKLQIIQHYLKDYNPHVFSTDIDYIMQNYGLDWKGVPADFLLIPQPLLLKKKGSYVGPKLDFEYATMREFIMIDDLLAEYISELKMDRNVLYKLVATMLRMRDISRPDGRVAIDPKSIHNNTAILERYADCILTRSTVERLSCAALLYAIGLKEKVHTLYAKWLFSGSEAASDQLNLGWQGIAMQVAEGGVFGNYEAVLDSQFHDVCAWLVIKKQEADRFDSAAQRSAAV